MVRRRGARVDRRGAALKGWATRRHKAAARVRAAKLKVATRRRNVQAEAAARVAATIARQEVKRSGKHSLFARDLTAQATAARKAAKAARSARTKTARARAARRAIRLGQASIRARDWSAKPGPRQRGAGRAQRFGESFEPTGETRSERRPFRAGASYLGYLEGRPGVVKPLGITPWGRSSEESIPASDRERIDAIVAAMEGDPKANRKAVEAGWRAAQGDGVDIQTEVKRQSKRAKSLIEEEEPGDDLDLGDLEAG